MFEIFSIGGFILFAIIAAASITLNIYLIRKLLYFNENLDLVVTSSDGFIKHLGKIYDMQTFYGDETLSGLLEHSKQLKEDLQEFKDRYEYGTTKEEKA
tara:strand:- start:6689 stop:6985 length:297 start_codon:yes stop_codon:yes gene_type:complete